jgi:hypothetical protein
MLNPDKQPVAAHFHLRRFLRGEKIVKDTASRWRHATGLHSSRPRWADSSAVEVVC